MHIYIYVPITIRAIVQDKSAYSALLKANKVRPSAIMEKLESPLSLLITNGQTMACKPWLL